MKVNMNYYRYFIWVMKEGSMTKAAEKMGVRQPSVTYNIKGLEKNLKHKLFEVKQNGMQPLPRAVWLYKKTAPAYLLLQKTFKDFTAKD